MAKTETKKVSRIKVQKKTWFKILAPKVFGEKEVGEIYLNSLEPALGRSMKVNLRDLTGNVRDQNIYIAFRLEKSDGSTLKTSLIGYELTAASVKRMVKKNCNRIDDYFVLKTKDGKEAVFKTLSTTFNKANRSVVSAIRKELGVMLKEEVGKLTFDSLVQHLVGYKIQASVKKKLGKIYPLREVTVRVLKLTGNTQEIEESNMEVAQPDLPKEAVESVEEALAE
jgi:small subunit ribosomal protein S3Ae